MYADLYEVKLLFPEEVSNMRNQTPPEGRISVSIWLSISANTLFI